MRASIRKRALLFPLALTGCAAVSAERARFDSTPAPDVHALSSALDEVMQNGQQAPEPAAETKASLAAILRMSQTRSPLLAAAYYRWKAAVASMTRWPR